MPSLHDRPSEGFRNRTPPWRHAMTLPPPRVTDPGTLRKHLLAVLLIMKRIRTKWEDDFYNTWSYNFSYSTRWMGIDKKSPVTELKRVSLDLKKFT